MSKPKVIFLNGVSGSGKTSIAKALQVLANDEFYHLSNEMFLNLEREMFNRLELKQFRLNDENCKYMAESAVIMYHTAKVLAEQGTNVIIDGMLFETSGFNEKYGKTNYESLRQILTGFDVFMVHVFCPLDECRRRNISRTDRGENQARDQMKIMNRHIHYNLTVDTSANTAVDCAKKILSELYGLP